MSFNPDDPRITAYVFGELDDQQRAAFQAELDQSAELREAVQQTQATLDQLSGELQAEPQMAMSDAQRKNVEQEIQRASASDTKPPLVAGVPPIADGGHSGRRWAALAVLAASLLLVCGLAYMYQVRNAMQRITASVGQGDMALQHEETPLGASSEPQPDYEQLDIELFDDADASTEYGVSGQGVSKDEASKLASAVAPSAADAYASSRVSAQPVVSGGRQAQFAAEAAELQKQLAEKVQSGARQNRLVDAALPVGSSQSGDVSKKGEDKSLSLSFAPVSGRAPNANKNPGVSRLATVPASAAPTTAPAPADGYGEMSGYGATSGYDSMSVAPAPTPAPGQLAAGGALYGGSYEAARSGAGGMGGMGGGGYGGGRTDTSYSRGYGMESRLGDAGVEVDFEVDGRGGYLAPQPDSGTGPGASGDKYEPIVENAFQAVTDHPLSTFSIDVDTASYSKVRMYLMQNNSLPRPDAVRIEEMVNYFTYDYQPPEDDVPFAAHIEVADCPWTPEHRLVRFGIKGQEIETEKRPTSNLVFLLDVSGSMRPANKLPLVKQGMKMLVDQLGENDRVAIAVYAGAAGLVLDSTTGDQKQVILDSLDRLHAGGSTNGGQGIQLAYQTALDNFVGGGVNRVILCTDGDFNVGTTGTDELVRLAEENAKTGVYLSVLGFGMGNHNDSMLEQVSNKGNGNYAYIDNEAEARKVLVEEMMGTLVTIAKDVKIQVEFNPAEVAAYRLIGYENRILAAEDFNDDKKDAGEIGAGHTVTALYEVVPAGSESGLATAPVDDLRYQSDTKLSKAAKTGEMLTLKMRYKQPDGDTSALLTFPVKDEGYKFGQASQDFRFAASVASFGMLLRNSQHKGNATYAGVLETATEAASSDTSGYRAEFLRMIQRAKQLSGQQ